MNPPKPSTTSGDTRPRTTGHTRVSNDPRKRAGKRNPKQPGLQRINQTTILPANPPRPPTPKPPAEALADRVLDNTPMLGARNSVSLILKEISLAGAKQFELSDGIVAAVPVVASKLMTKASGDNPSNDDLDLAERGARLVIKANEFNLKRFEEANKTEEQKLEITVEKGVFIIPAPVIGKLGETPKERQ